MDYDRERRLLEDVKTLKLQLEQSQELLLLTVDWIGAQYRASLVARSQMKRVWKKVFHADADGDPADVSLRGPDMALLPLPPGLTADHPGLPGTYSFQREKCLTEEERQAIEEKERFAARVRESLLNTKAKRALKAKKKDDKELPGNLGMY